MNKKADVQMSAAALVQLIFAAGLIAGTFLILLPWISLFFQTDTRISDDAIHAFNEFVSMYDNCLSKHSDDCFICSEFILFWLPDDYALRLTGDNTESKVSLYKSGVLTEKDGKFDGGLFVLEKNLKNLNEFIITKEMKENVKFPIEGKLLIVNYKNNVAILNPRESDACDLTGYIIEDICRLCAPGAGDLCSKEECLDLGNCVHYKESPVTPGGLCYSCTDCDVPLKVCEECANCKLGVVNRFSKCVPKPIELVGQDKVMYDRINDYQIFILPSVTIDISADLIRAIIAVESSGNPDLVSNKGAIGLMQVKLATAKQIAKDISILDSYGNKILAEDITIDSLKEPHINIPIGVAYLDSILQRDFINWELEKALAAYNTGPTGYNNVINGCTKSYWLNCFPTGTQKYVKDILEYEKKFYQSRY